MKVANLNQEKLLGRIVISKVGRDKGKSFIIVGLINSDYVIISDGKLRTFERAKKKKNKHLIFTQDLDEEIYNLLLLNMKISNSILKESLKVHGYI
jgi:hypothetical protein